MGFDRNGYAMSGPLADAVCVLARPSGMPPMVPEWYKPAPTARPPGMPPMTPEWYMQREREREAALKTTAGIANATEGPPRARPRGPDFWYELLQSLCMFSHWYVILDHGIRSWHDLVSASRQYH